METQSPPAWLTDIRDYWSRMTLKLGDESGGPGAALGEEASGKSFGAHTPLPESQPLAPGAHPVLTEDAE